MFRDDGDSLKMSLRSAGDWDVGLIAKKLGGGGHSHSAATLITKGPKDDTNAIINKTIAQVETILEEMKASQR